MGARLLTAQIDELKDIRLVLKLYESRGFKQIEPN